jgi:hypothetical protein
VQDHGRPQRRSGHLHGESGVDEKQRHQHVVEQDADEDTTLRGCAGIVAGQGAGDANGQERRAGDPANKQRLGLRRLDTKQESQDERAGNARRARPVTTSTMAVTINRAFRRISPNLQAV